jgi:3-deoxy-D-manno-octulosonate 8-phosphate phosphatase (KDO 8-P phosphatase)
VQIDMLVMDVDGVLTDGGIILHDDGTESKRFDVRDGAWLRIWSRLGKKTAIITGRHCAAVEHRAAALKIDFVYQACHHKLATLDQLITDSGVRPDRMAYIGDDLMDLSVMQRVGFSATVETAVPELLDMADFVSPHAPGYGAVYGLIRHLITSMGLYDAATQRYFHPTDPNAL